MTMLSALNQRAQLQANTLQSDGGGGYCDAWQTFAMVWVKIAPLTPSERYGPGRLEAKGRHAITLRRRSDLAAGQIVAASARRFKVLGIEDSGPQASFVTLLCEELP